MQDQRARQPVAGKGPRRITKNHARQLIEQQQVCQPAYGVSLPGTQLASQALLGAAARLPLPASDLAYISGLLALAIHCALLLWLCWTPRPERAALLLVVVTATPLLLAGGVP